MPVFLLLCIILKSRADSLLKAETAFLFIIIKFDFIVASDGI